MSILKVNNLGTARVIVDIVPKGNFEIRPAYGMLPTAITIHNTGNAGRGANAKAHNTYIHNMAKKTPLQTGYASWHFSVDDKYIYQHIPMNETAWHCGDGSGINSGNRSSIGIEICENPEMDYAQAEENAIALTVHLMKLYNIKANKVKPHQDWSGKYCPRVILKRDNGFTKFRNRVEKALAGKEQPASSPANVTVHKIVRGDSLSVLAKKYGTTVSELKTLNGLKSDTIYIGETLVVKRKATAGKVTRDCWLHTKAEARTSTRKRWLTKGETYKFYGEEDGMYKLGTGSYIDKRNFSLY